MTLSHTAIVLNGKETADHLLTCLAQKIKTHTQGEMRAPTLAVIIIGNNPASTLYVNTKKVAAEKIGIRSIIHEFPESITEHELINTIHNLNNDDTIDGILVQLPLPHHINKNNIIENIHPDKDVDGFHPIHLGRLAQGQPSMRPCTPYGIIKLLEYYHITLTGLHAVIIGASTIVGRPMALELLLAGCTVSICHSKTSDATREALLKTADIIISATGKQGLMNPELIKSNTIIIDVGIHRDEKTGYITGDIDFDAASKKARYITPVPGGVGPMTVAILLDNTVHAWEKKRKA